MEQSTAHFSKTHLKNKKTKTKLDTILVSVLYVSLPTVNCSVRPPLVIDGATSEFPLSGSV